jgi:hypothetical protein
MKLPRRRFLHLAAGAAALRLNQDGRANEMTTDVRHTAAPGGNPDIERTFARGPRLDPN